MVKHDDLLFLVQTQHFDDLWCHTQVNVFLLVHQNVDIRYNHEYLTRRLGACDFVPETLAPADKFTIDLTL